MVVTSDYSKRFYVPEVKAMDTTGAGDSFTAGLITALLENKGLEEAVEFANLVASISVTRMGARTTPHRHETRDEE